MSSILKFIEEEFSSKPKTFELILDPEKPNIKLIFSTPESIRHAESVASEAVKFANQVAAGVRFNGRYADAGKKELAIAYTAHAFCSGVSGVEDESVPSLEDWAKISTLNWQLIHSIGEAIDRASQTMVFMVTPEAIKDAKKN